MIVKLNRMVEKYSLWELLEEGKTVAYSLVKACATEPDEDARDYKRRYFDVPFTPAWTPGITQTYRVYYEDFIPAHPYNPKFGYRVVTEGVSPKYRLYPAESGVSLRELIGGLWRSNALTEEVLLPVVKDTGKLIRFNIWLDYWEREQREDDSPTVRGIRLALDNLHLNQSRM